ncbi:hypothetical protein MTBLM5_40177 [Magnetospirillum sp. LM-5]|nr:hypothetical protein MTBLM5_40177 [Magnetospirillum sp. LM-5]
MRGSPCRRMFVRRGYSVPDERSGPAGRGGRPADAGILELRSTGRHQWRRHRHLRRTQGHRTAERPDPAARHAEPA